MSFNVFWPLGGSENKLSMQHLFIALQSCYGEHVSTRLRH